MPRTALLCGLFAVLSLLPGMGKGSHYDSDDTLYAQMAREMVRTGDYVDNRWSGTVLFEKPPLVLWTLAAAGAWGEWREGPLRLPITMFGGACVAGLFALGLALGLSRRQALTACALLLTSILFLLMTRRLMMDVPLLAFGLWAGWAAVSGRRTALGVLCGLAVLTKGPAAAAPCAAVVLYALIDRRLSLRDLWVATGWGLLVAGPWHVWVTLRHGAEFWHSYVGYHVGARATSAVVPGVTRGQWLSLLLDEPVLLVASGIGLVSLVADRARRPVDRFALCWLVTTMAPPMLSATRLPHYLLPAIPALCLLSVRWIPAAAFAHRLAPFAATAAVLVAFGSHPTALTIWLEPDFSPAKKALAEVVAEAAAPQDRLVAWDDTTASLTFYADRRVWMVAHDERFYRVQEAVLMVRRADVLRRRLPPSPEGARRFVVVPADRAGPAVAALRAERPTTPLHRVVERGTWLVNDAGIGQPLSL